MNERGLPPGTPIDTSKIEARHGLTWAPLEQSVADMAAGFASRARD